MSLSGLRAVQEVIVNSARPIAGVSGPAQDHRHLERCKRHRLVLGPVLGASCKPPCCIGFSCGAPIGACSLSRASAWSGEMMPVATPTSPKKPRPSRAEAGLVVARTLMTAKLLITHIAVRSL